MLWWILLGGLVVGLLMLALAVRPVVIRLRGLQRALARLQARAAEFEALQAQITQTGSSQKHRR